MYKANNSRLVNGEIWICYIRNQNILKNIQRCFIANFHNFSIDIIHYKIFTYINSPLVSIWTDNSILVVFVNRPYMTCIATPGTSPALRAPGVANCSEAILSRG